MTISERLVGDAMVLDVSGALVHGQGDRLIGPAVQRQLNAGRHLVILNLDNVPSMDAAGLGALVGAYRATREAGCDLRLACVTKRIRLLLVRSRLATVFQTFDSVEQAAGAATEAHHGVAKRVTNASSLIERHFGSMRASISAGESR